MRHVVRKVSVVLIHCVLAVSLARDSAAQSCLGIDACLLSPTRSDASRPTSFNGCSVPPEVGPLGQFWGTVFVSACNQHDIDWGTFRSDIAGWFTQSNATFLANMLATCQARTDLDRALCIQAANLFHLGVSATSIAADIYRRSQYFASTCACRTLPGAPANLTAQVSSGPAGPQVRLEWTPG